ncbi:hypothetical protein ACIRBX_03725 [Kitasatospora sp. NPDC096147]|uniref:hypothetical protein n=1 Tax=Kitasatospora sp. NPDC096147 TaxID=3364093 RepID=UPI003822A466
MCRTDAAATAAAIAWFRREWPGAGAAGAAGAGHPALAGCEDADWPNAGVPVLLRSLLDQEAGPEAVRVLGNALMASPLHLGCAMPTALPFLIRLAADPTVPVRSRIIELLVVAVELSEPVDPADSAAITLLGSEEARPERARCRAALTAHADALRVLLRAGAVPDEVLGAEDRESLRRACGR